MQMKKVMTSCMVPFKTGQHLIENNSKNIKEVFIKVGTSNAHRKKKHNGTHRAVA